MAKNVSWSDDYWLLLMQLYLRKPVGVKALYSRGLVQLALELHIEPRVLRSQMFRLRQIDTPVTGLIVRSIFILPSCRNRHRTHLIDEEEHLCS